MDTDIKVLLYIIPTTLLLFYKKKKQVETEIRDLLVQEKRHSKLISRSLLYMKILIIVKTLFVIATFTSNIILLTMDLDLQSFILYSINSVFIFGLVVSNLKLKFSFDLKTSLEYRDFGCILDGMVSEPLDTVKFEFFVVLTQCYIILFEFGYLEYIINILAKLKFPPSVPEFPPLPNLPEYSTKNLIIVGYPLMSFLNLIISKCIQLRSKLVDRVLLNNTEPKQFCLFYSQINELLSIGSGLLIDEFDELKQKENEDFDYVIELPDQIEEGIGINEQTPLLNQRRESMPKTTLFSKLIYLNYNLVLCQQLISIIPVISTIGIPIVLACIINDMLNWRGYVIFIFLVFTESVFYNYANYIGSRISIRINTVLLKLAYDQADPIDIGITKRFFAKLFNIWCLPLQLVLFSGYIIYLDQKCILYILIILIGFVLNIGFEHVYENQKARNNFYQSQLQDVQKSFIQNYIDIVMFQLKPDIKEFLNFKKQSLFSLLFWKNVQIFCNALCSTGSIAILIIYYTITDRLNYDTLVTVYLFKKLSETSLEINAMLGDILKVVEVLDTLKTDHQQPKDVLIKSNLGINTVSYVLHIYPNTVFQHYSDTEQQFLLKYDGKGLTIPENRLTIICGDSGSGKTSLLMAIRSRLYCSSGGIYLGQSIIDEQSPVAYVSQKPWLLNGTIRENIIFGEEFETEKYYRTLSCCDLISDIQNLPKQDFTHCQELELDSSVTQRICLARALYSESRLVLIDSSLESVQPGLKLSIFERAICGLLQHKTRIFVTNDTELFTKADLVINISNGVIKPIHVFEQQYTEPLQTNRVQKISSQKWQSPTCFEYLKNAGGILFPLFFPLFILIKQLSLFLCDLFVILLIDYLPTINDDIDIQLQMYSVTYLATIAGLYVLFSLNQYGGSLASTKVVEKSFNSIFTNSIQFLSHFNYEMYSSINFDIIDECFMDNIQNHYSQISWVLIILILPFLVVDNRIRIVLGLILCASIYFGVKYMRLAKNVEETSNNLQRNIYTWISEAKVATDIASAFCQHKFVSQKLFQELDYYNRTLLLETATACWISIRIDFIAGCIFTSVFLSLQLSNAGDRYGAVALTLVSLLALPSTIKELFKNYLAMCRNFQELAKLNNFRPRPFDKIKFPESYKIQLQNATFAFSEDTVLNDINITIDEGDRIGITLENDVLDSRWMIQNCTITEGSISVGGVDCLQFHHSDLFKNITVIPNNFNLPCPVKEFIDPDFKYNEHEIINL
ncbi:hypothetical protein HDV01_001669 [Terramyces sp. JEL0728]|nr:hypothetical protein HDV01_001669 [Terramyces sp. JEL0728]